jgi:hypothetical protein
MNSVPEATLLSQSLIKSDLHSSPSEFSNPIHESSTDICINSGLAQLRIQQILDTYGSILQCIKRFAILTKSRGKLADKLASVQLNMSSWISFMKNSSEKYPFDLFEVYLSEHVEMLKKLQTRMTDWLREAETAVACTEQHQVLWWTWMCTVDLSFDDSLSYGKKSQSSSATSSDNIHNHNRNHNDYNRHQQFTQKSWIDRTFHKQYRNWLNDCAQISAKSHAQHNQSITSHSTQSYTTAAGRNSLESLDKLIQTNAYAVNFQDICFGSTLFTCHHNPSRTEAQSSDTQEMLQVFAHNRDANRDGLHKLWNQRSGLTFADVTFFS